MSRVGVSAAQVMRAVSRKKTKTRSSTPWRRPPIWSCRPFELVFAADPSGAALRGQNRCWNLQGPEFKHPRQHMATAGWRWSSPSLRHWRGRCPRSGIGARPGNGREPLLDARRSPQAVRHLRLAGGDTDPQAGRPAKVIGGRGVGADTAGPADDWHCVLRVILLSPLRQRCRTVTQESVAPLTHTVSACQHAT